MAIDETERLLDDVGQLLAEDRGYPLDGTLLYARLDYNTIGPPIFKEFGNQTIGGQRSSMWFATADPTWPIHNPDQINPDEDCNKRRGSRGLTALRREAIVYPH